MNHIKQVLLNWTKHACFQFLDSGQNNYFDLILGPGGAPQFIHYLKQATLNSLPLLFSKHLLLKKVGGASEPLHFYQTK